MEIQNVSEALGAEITDIDLAEPLNEVAKDAIRRVFLERSVLVIRDQDLTPKEQVRFAQIFGNVVPYPFLEGLPDCPEVIEVLTRPTDSINFGGGWHSDTPYLESPSLGSVLYAKELPPKGGDTLFSNMYLAYEALDAETKALLEGRRALHSSSKRYVQPADRSKIYGAMKRKKQTKGEVNSDTYHPVFRTHPETGRKALYLSYLHTVGVEGMTETEAEAVLKRLYEHQCQEEFTCRVQWRPGTLVLWDNRCGLHNALFDYAGHTRRMHRVTIEGERPV
jgi:taurine dioxygenase